MNEVIPNSVVAQLIGNQVDIRSNTGDNDCSDMGVLEDWDPPFLMLRKGDSEILCFPIYNVRLIKLVKRLRKVSDPKTTLLRPADSPPQPND